MTAPAPTSRIGMLERRQLNGTFVELCRIPSPSLSERACAELVMAELGALGIELIEDGAGAEIGSDCGNLLARIPADADGAGPGPDRPRPSVALCAHLDTVPLQAPVEPVLEDGFWVNANEGILGADNKAAVAVLLAVARHIATAGAPLDVELLFTVGEEISLAGSGAFDASVLRSECAYVFDHASPIGEVIVGSPCHYRIDACFRGAAAHAGIQPQEGRSAIRAAALAVASLRHGQLEGEGTVNVGTIAGGSAINIVPERCSLLAEVRGVDDEHGEALAAEVVDRLSEAANRPECECDVDISVRRTFAGYRLAGASRPLQAAEAALRACGHEPRRIWSGGGSDANALIAKGVPTVNIANGTERPHEPGERVSAQALEEMLQIVLVLLDELAVRAPARARTPAPAPAPAA